MIQDPSPDNLEEFVKYKKAASKIMRQEKRAAEKELIQKIEEHRFNCALDSCYKILSLELLRRLEVYSRDIIGDYQSGFLRGKSTSDHIFTIRQMMKKFYEFGKDVHMCFVDFRQAYNSIV